MTTLDIGRLLARQRAFSVLLKTPTIRESSAIDSPPAGAPRISARFSTSHACFLPRTKRPRIETAEDLGNVPDRHAEQAPGQNSAAVDAAGSVRRVECAAGRECLDLAAGPPGGKSTDQVVGALSGAPVGVFRRY
jgi:hypothetical protein